MVEELDKETQEDPIPPLPKGFKVVKSSGGSDLPPLPQGYSVKKKDLASGDIGGTVGSSKAPSSVSIEPPNPKDNPFGIGQQFNKPPKLEAEKLDLSNTQHNAAIAEQIKTPLKKIPLTPILDNTKMEKPITEIDKREAERKYKQHQIDMETAIDNTTLKVLKQKGIVAGKGSPYYEAERKKIEEKTKPTMIGGIVVNGAEATYHKDKDGNIGLDRNLGFLEGIRKGFNSAVEGEDEANAFAQMDTKQKVEYANKQMEGKPTEYMEERGGVGELLGGAAPYLIKATAAATAATAAGIAAPASGGASLVGLAPVLTVLLTAPDMIKQGQKDEVMTRYMQLKQENPFSKDEDLMKIAEQGEISGGIVGAAEALAFTTSLKLPILKDSKDVLTTYLKGVASSAVHLGGIMSGTTAAKIAERKLEGYNVDTDKAIDEIATSFTENATAGAILNGIISGAHILPKAVKSAFKYALKDTPTSEIKTALDANVQAGRIPPEVAEQTISDIVGYKEALAKTADGLKPETQASVAGLIQARDNVAAEMATKDPTQRAVYEQKIEAYNKQIEKITETNDPLKYEIDEVTGNPIDKVAPKGEPEQISKPIELSTEPTKKAEDTKLSQPIEGVDEQGIPIGDNVPTPTEVSGKDVVVDEGKIIDTGKGRMYGAYGDVVTVANKKVKLPKPGFYISDVSLNEGEVKGKGSGQEIYIKALKENGRLYSTSDVFPISEDAMRVQEALEKKGLITIRNEKIDGVDFRVIEPTEKFNQEQSLSTPKQQSGKDVVVDKASNGGGDVSANQFTNTKPNRKDFKDGAEGDGLYNSSLSTHNKQLNSYLYNLSDGTITADGIIYNVRNGINGAVIEDAAGNTVFKNGKWQNNAQHFSENFKYEPKNKTTEAKDISPNDGKGKETMVAGTQGKVVGKSDVVVDDVVVSKPLKDVESTAKALEELSKDKTERFYPDDKVILTTKDGKEVEVSFRGYNGESKAVIFGSRGSGINQMEVDVSQLRAKNKSDKLTKDERKNLLSKIDFQDKEAPAYKEDFTDKELQDLSVRYPKRDKLSNKEKQELNDLQIATTPLKRWQEQEYGVDDPKDPTNIRLEKEHATAIQNVIGNNKLSTLLSEAYHKAKKDGSNPELVKAVEQSLSTPKAEVVDNTTPKGNTSNVGGDVVNNGLKLEGSPREIIKELKGRKDDKAIHAEIFQKNGYNVFIYDNNKILVDKTFKTHEEAKKYLDDWSGENGKDNQSKYDYGTITDIANPPYRQEITGNLPKDFIEKNKAKEQPKSKTEPIKNEEAQVTEDTNPQTTTSKEQPLVTDPTSKGETGKTEAEVRKAIEEAAASKKSENGKKVAMEEEAAKHGKVGEKVMKDIGGEPPIAEAEPTERSGDKFKDKGILNRLYNAENIPEYVKERLKDEGLKYEPQTRDEAAKVAKGIVEQYGIDDAVTLAETGRLKGGVNSAVFAEALNRLYEMEQSAKTPQEKLEIAKKNAEVIIRFDEAKRSQGRDISQIQHFYKNSPLGVKLAEEAKAQERFTEFAKKKEQSWREFFNDLKKEPEFEEVVKEDIREELKKERAEARKARIKKVDDIFDKAKDQFKGGAAYSTIIPPKLITGALEGMKKAYHAGEKVAKVIEDAIEYISKEIGGGWDKEKFRKEWQDKLGEYESKKEIPLDKREKILEKFRNKLKGLSEKEKDEVIRRSFKRLVENGALEYADFKKIIGETLGYGELSVEKAKKITELVNELNAVDDLAVKVRENERDAEALKNYQAAKKKAERAATELGKLVYNKPNIIKRLLSVMQLNTLGVPSLINNPIFNVANQSTVRLPRSIIMTGIDYGIYGVGKLFGKDYKPENNVFHAQLEFYNKLGYGSRQSVEQLFTGLTNMDYFQKEVYASQIKPLSSMRELWAYSKGDLKLSREQVIDKTIQATVGIPAEAVARVLNIGDKPQRFAAEGGQAAVFAKNLGLKGIDYKLFMEFPKEEAYRALKKQGLSDEVAMKKAEEIQERIIKEGEESTFQQDNLLNDVINAAFEATKKYGEGTYALASTAKTLNMPFVKIPLNAFWSVYNLANPEVALLQSVVYGIKALKTKSATDIQASKKWFAHAVTGMAWMYVTGAIAKAGIINASNPDDTTKKEREGEGYYEQQNSINMSKLMAYMKGENPDEVKNGLNVDLKWLGNMGILMGYQAQKLEEMTPEQRENGLGFMEDMTANLSTSALDFMDKGVFSNTGSLFTAINKGGSFMDNYLINLINMGTNIVQPAAFAQLSRAQLPYYSKAKADTFMGQLKNNMLTRSSLLRDLTGQYPPSKIGIWGDKLEKKDNTMMRLFGISTANDDNFAQPLYEDYKKTKNTKFFPPSVKPEIRGNGETIKLPPKAASELEILVGQERKKLVAPYVNDMATFAGSNKKYSQLSDEEKTEKLSILYEEGFRNGKYLFQQTHPEYKIPEQTNKDKKEKKKESRSNRVFRKSLSSKY